MLRNVTDCYSLDNQDTDTLFMLFSVVLFKTSI